MLRINGEEVDPALIEEAFSRLTADAEARLQVSCCERDAEFRLQAEQEVVDGILLSQEAERRVPEPAAEDVRSAFEQVLRQWREHGASWDLLEARRADLRQETIAGLKLERFTGDIWNALPPLTDADLRAWYEAHLERFRTPAAAEVLHLVRFPGEGANDPWEEYGRLLELRARALAGEDFAALAQAATAKKDGTVELGWIEQERLFNPFEAMLFSLREGEVSPVFFYEQAYHLVKAIAVRPASVKPFAEVAEIVREECDRERRRDALQQLATELRATARIERGEVGAV